MTRRRAVLAAARWAGTLVRVARRPVLALPGLAGAGAVSAGAGEIVGQVFGHGLALWTGLLVGGVFLIRIGAEINAAPPAPRRDDD